MKFVPDSLLPLGLYVGVSVVVLFLVILLTTLFIVVAMVKKRQGYSYNYYFTYSI